MQKLTQTLIMHCNEFHFKACACYISAGINTCKYVSDVETDSVVAESLPSMWDTGIEFVLW